VSIARKADSKKIQEHINGLKEQLRLGEARSWWPRFLFRFDDIAAAAKILNEGRLLCRNSAKALGVMGVDCASPEVIKATAEKWKQYVRLYFRPRTPTQYHSEGFRPSDRRELGSHCPVPVVMLFDALDILTREDTQFSDGNLAARKARTGGDAAFLRRIPFKDVYHEGPFDASEKADIIFHRHAEVIVPNELELSPLRYIGCRTQAEYETLLHLLDPEARRAWSVKMGAKANLHYRFWTFVEEVELTRERIRFQFNPSSRTPGPFRASLQIQEDATGGKYAWKSDGYIAKSTLGINLRGLSHPESYKARLELDGNLAYANHYQDEEIPF
jgi:hypothetical protein